VVVIPPGRRSERDDHQRRGDMAAKAKKVAFGGYSINFKGCSDTLESVMGSSPITPPEMTKRIWGYVKKRKLGGKKK
jgi:chromatin remodeling complex protein RSC6